MRRTRKFSMRISEREYTAMHDAAQVAQLPVSEFVRDAIKSHIERWEKKKDKPHGHRKSA